jgi:hypothetical protein
VKPIWTGKAAQVAAKYGDHAPVATACCNACRTCVATNVLALGTAAAGVAAARVARLVKPKPS